MYGARPKMSLNRIIEYDMDERETKVFKCCLLWEKVCRNMFPNEKCSKLRKNGDPRKSYLFRCCYKMVKEYDQQIQDNEYKLFIYAQCDILRGIVADGQHASIDPTCLAGPKAWSRWIVWKKKYDESRKFSGSYKKIRPTFLQMKLEIERTRLFLEDIFKKPPTDEDLRAASDNRTVLRWVALGKVSPYFIVLCEQIDNNQPWGLDLMLYQEHITPEIKDWFNLA